MSKDDPTVNELIKGGKLDEASEALWEEFNRARDAETRAINEFEKVLWLANSGAATITIGYVTTTTNPTFLQFLGSSLFVCGIVSLFIMKLIGETISVRDRIRRQKTSANFFHEGVPLSSFNNVRDRIFAVLTWIYKIMKSSAAIFFLAGCIITLMGLYPLVSNKTDNIQLPPTSENVDAG